MRANRCAPVAALALVAAGCGEGPVISTVRAVHEVYATRTAATGSSATEWRDGWGRAFRVAGQDASLQLRSAGADGAFGTGDDLDFSPEYLAARATAVAGCFTVASLAYPRGEVHRLELTNRRVDGAPDFRGSTDLAGTDTRWIPWGRDSVVVFLMVSVQFTLIVAKVEEGSLVGTLTRFGEGPLAVRAKPVFFEGRRTACDAARASE